MLNFLILFRFFIIDLIGGCLSHFLSISLALLLSGDLRFSFKIFIKFIYLNRNDITHTPHWPPTDLIQTLDHLLISLCHICALTSPPSGKAI